MKITKTPRAIVSRPSFVTHMNPICMSTEQNPHCVTSINEAFKAMKNLFKCITEIGKFEKIKITILSPLKDSTVQKAYLILEPSANKNDFRTRILSFVADSPYVQGQRRSVTQATGNKFAIDSVLKNKSSVSAFKDFIRDSERFFFMHE